MFDLFAAKCWWQHPAGSWGPIWLWRLGAW